MVKAWLKGDRSIRVSISFTDSGEEFEVKERATRTAGTSYSLILGGLDPDTSYGVRVYSCSASLRSRGSNMVVAKTTFGM